MATLIVRRILGLIPVVVAISILVFLMIHLIPGDPVAMMLGEAGVSQEAVDNVRQQLGLNDPLWVQYRRFALNALHGDLGRSMLQNRKVEDLIAAQLPATMELTMAGLVLAVLSGLVIGVIAAVRQNTWVDSSSMVVALLGISMPSFWLSLLLIFLFSLRLGWLPATGRGGFVRLIMPSIALGFGVAALLARMVRSSMLDVLSQDYVRTARAKGLSERVVVYKHALTNALIPVVTVVGLEFGRLMSGAVVIETVFARAGIGRLTVTAILSKDYPLVQGAVLVSALVYLAANLIVDISYAWIDPRIRYS